MVVERRTPHGQLLGLLTAMIATFALTPMSWATSDGAHDTQYFFVDSEDPLGPPAGQWEFPIGAVALDDDELTDPIDLTFNFMYFGQNYRTCRVSANGFITFGIGSGAFDNQPIPTIGLPEAVICPFWDDLIVPDPGGGVSTFTSATGTPTAAIPLGSRRFVVTWENVTFFSDQAGQFNSISVQCILFEGSNDIEFRYRAPRGPLGRGDSATIGLEDETGRFGNQYVFDGTPEENHVYDGLVIRWTSYTQSITSLVRAGLADADYSATSNDKRQRHGEGSHLCFVTNASYGSPLAPEVKLLSRFRDVYLMPTAPGRDFVDFYYRSSPPLARIIARDEGFKLPVQMALRPPIWFASFMLFSTAAEKAGVAALVLVLGMVLGRAMCRRLAEPER